jgi:hypothetical protein
MPSVNLQVLHSATRSCESHASALQAAVKDIDAIGLDNLHLEHLDALQLRLLDQFAYRFTRLQDDMGAKLYPALLRAAEEDVATLPMIDKLSRLERLGWLPSANDWLRWRDVRNEFTHDYPDAVTERDARLRAAVFAAQSLLLVHAHVQQVIQKRFPVKNKNPTQNVHDPKH